MINAADFEKKVGVEGCRDAAFIWRRRSQIRNVA